MPNIPALVPGKPLTRTEANQIVNQIKADLISGAEHWASACQKVVTFCERPPVGKDGQPLQAPGAWLAKTLKCTPARVSQMKRVGEMLERVGGPRKLSAFNLLGERCFLPIASLPPETQEVVVAEIQEAVDDGKEVNREYVIETCRAHDPKPAFMPGVDPAPAYTALQRLQRSVDRHKDDPHLHRQCRDALKALDDLIGRLLPQVASA